jgi:single-strand DNA-binding protein
LAIEIIAIGNVANIKVATTKAGDSVVNFSLASNRKWKDGSTGEQMQETDWLDCVAFRRLAEMLATNLDKGTKVFVRGEYRKNQYEKDGQTRYQVQCIVDKFEFASPKDDSAGEHKITKEEDKAAPEFDDDIPF